jgi:RPA family protein
MTTTTSKREVAWRLFAKEFNSATTVIPGDEQYAPTYVLSPLGALINRVYITGVLTECENVGTDQEPLWRGRVSDPSDVFYISAGQFQPKAARLLAELEVPSLVGITGKARTYSPDESTTYVSVRVEFIKQITQEVRDYWVLEACAGLQYRLEAIHEALKMDPVNISELTALGYSKKIASGIVEAMSQYDDIDIEPFNELLANTLSELTMETSMNITVSKGQTASGELLKGMEKQQVRESSPLSEADLTFTTPTEGDGLSKEHTGDAKVDIEGGSATVEPVENAEAAKDAKDAKAAEKIDAEVAEEVTEHLIFEIITSLAEDNPDGVNYGEVTEKAVEQGLEAEVIEESIGSLIDKGMIYEPSIGLFKAV